MNSIKRYYDLGTFLKEHFPFKVQKLTLNAGFTCPNRDGFKGRGGCTYCNNQTFSPAFQRTPDRITTQLQKGTHFFAHKYPNMRYLAYFQSFSNTYAPLAVLKEKFEEALRFPGVVGLIIATRPDCVADDVLDYLGQLAKHTFILIEYGIESTSDQTLQEINRGHTYAEAVDAIKRSHDRGIMTGAHVIMGLPGEQQTEMIARAKQLSALPLTTLKLHQLQLIKGTRMTKQYQEEPFPLFTADDYIALVCEFLTHSRPDLVMDRFVSQSPKELLFTPGWGLKNYEFTAKVDQRLQQLDLYQGCRYTPLQ